MYLLGYGKDLWGMSGNGAIGGCARELRSSWHCIRGTPTCRSLAPGCSAPMRERRCSKHTAHLVEITAGALDSDVPRHGCPCSVGATRGSRVQLVSRFCSGLTLPGNAHRRRTSRTLVRGSSCDCGASAVNISPFRDHQQKIFNHHRAGASPGTSGP